jgi:hypothetical protein
MKRYLATLLVVLGVVGLVGVLAVGRGFADDENAAGAKCSVATLHGTYLFAQNGVEIKGNDQRPFAIAGYEVFDGNGKVNAVFSANVKGTATYADGTRFDQFIAPDGSQLTFVQTKPSEFVEAAFEPWGTAKRVGE